MTTIRKYSIIAILLLISILGNSQNLVPNYDFEDYQTCPYILNTLENSTGWIRPNQGTTDFFDTCATPQAFCDVPDNYFGTQLPYSGGGYAGFYAFYKWPYSYREYCQTKLTSPLVANQKYFVSCWVSLADSSYYATDDIGIYLSQNQISANHDSTLIFNPQVSNPQSQFLTNKTTWVKIFGSYIASGGEEYITIGNFKNDQNTDTMVASLPHFLKFDEKSSYYYLDRICVSTDSMYCYVENDEFTGINEYNSGRSQIFYANNQVNIQVNGDYRASIIDIYGIRRKEVALSGTQSIDVTDLENGCYFIVLENNTGTIRKKVLISK